MEDIEKVIVHVARVAEAQLVLNGNLEARLFLADRPFEECHAYRWCRDLVLACLSYELDPSVVARAAVGRRVRLVGPYFGESDLERYRWLCDNARSSAAAAAMGAALEAEHSEKLRAMRERGRNAWTEHARFP